MNIEGRNDIQIALDPHVNDVWFDGNEEIIEVGATCPNSDCLNPVFATFTRPNITSKIIRDKRCGEPMAVIRPAFSFEIRDGETFAQKSAVIQPFQPENVNRKSY